MPERPQDYKTKLASLVPSVRAALSLHELDNDHQRLDRHCMAWFATLYGEIPLSKLEAVTFAAIKEKIKLEPDRRKNFGPADVLAFWNTQYKKSHIVDQLNKPCEHCKGTFVLKIYSPIERKEVEKPCPFHSDAETRSKP